VRIGKKAGGHLVQALGSSDPNVRRWAAWTLGKLKYEKAAEHLALALQDEDGGVQFAAEVALAEIEG
jgi:HEAT repeat protein